MKFNVGIPGLILLFLTPLAKAYSQQQSQCTGLTGASRTRCLEAEYRRRTAEAEAARKRLERLDRQMRTACDLVAVLDKTAELARRMGELSHDKRLTYGGMTWTSVRALMIRLTQERRNCDDARRAVEEARRRVAAQPR